MGSVFSGCALGEMKNGIVGIDMFTDYTHFRTVSIDGAALDS